MALIPRGSGGTGTGGTTIIRVLWDFSHTVTQQNLDDKFLSVPSSDPEIAAGAEPKVIVIVDGIAQFLDDYTAVAPRKIGWDAQGLELVNPLKVGDKVWIIYPIELTVSSGGGSSGTSNHEALTSLFGGDTTNGHWHLTKEQWAQLLDILGAGNGDFDGAHNKLAGLQGGVADEYYHFSEEEHDDLLDLLTGGGNAGDGIHNHLNGLQGGSTDERYHFTEEEYDKIINIIKPQGPGGDDDPDDPDYEPRGHEELAQLLPAGLAQGDHNHLSKDQLDKIVEIIKPQDPGKDDDPDSPDYEPRGHEELEQLLPTGLVQGDHYHLKKRQLDELVKIIDPLGPGESDDPDDPDYAPRGHEELEQLFPLGLAAGDHFHLSKDQQEDIALLLANPAPSRPTIYYPADNQAYSAIGDPMQVICSYFSPVGLSVANIKVQISANADFTGGTDEFREYTGATGVPEFSVPVALDGDI
jgi:hypothetical protein